MSLNARERQVTGGELTAHVEALGVSNEAIGAAAGLDADDVAAVLRMGDVDPSDVWAVRDVLDAEASRRGVDAGGWSVLTDASRAQASRWFALRQVGAIAAE